MNISLSTKAPTPPALITNLSDEQAAAVNHVTTTNSNLVLIAPAGSGKSYTLEAILCAINNTYPTATCALLSFNSKIETELDGKVRRRGILNTTVRTAHKYGKRACENHLGTFRRDTIDKYKIHKLLSKYPIPIPYAVAKSIERLISLGKDAGVGIFLPNIRSTWEALFNHHDIDHDDDKFPLSRYFTIAENVLTLSNSDTKTLDIADLIYLPLLHNWPIPQYDFVIVDEAQDINAVRRELIKRMLKTRACIHCGSTYGIDMPDECQVRVGEACERQGGRLIAVGDPHQAIYGFTGADHDALDLLTSTFNATTLRLTVSRRCSQAVSRKAREVLTTSQLLDKFAASKKIFESLPDAPEGSTTRITLDDFNKRLPTIPPTSAILCRLNAPLIETAIYCLRHRIPCRVEGKDVARQLLSIIWKLKATDIRSFTKLLHTYRSEQQSKLSPWKFETLDDKLTCCSLLASTLQPNDSIKKLESSIEALFSDYDPTLPPTLTFSTVHKSKGLEFPTVYLLGRNLYMPSRRATLPWMLTQENNLIYVAITRSITHLIDVDMPEK